MSARFLLGCLLVAVATCQFTPGCDMGGCSPQNSFSAGLIAPAQAPAPSVLLALDGAAVCSSNGLTAACSSPAATAGSLVFDHTGRVLTALPSRTASMAPVMNAAGDVLLVNSTHLAYLNLGGDVLWETSLLPTFPGPSTSATITAAGIAVFVSGPYITAYLLSGIPYASIDLTGKGRVIASTPVTYATRPGSR